MRLTDITDVILCSDWVKLFLFWPRGSEVMDGLRETVAFSYSLDLTNPALLGEWTFSCSLKKFKQFKSNLMIKIA